MKEILIALLRDAAFSRIIVTIEHGSLRVRGRLEGGEMVELSGINGLDSVVLFLVKNPEVDGLVFECVPGRSSELMEFKVSSTCRLGDQDFGVAEILPVHQLDQCEKLLDMFNTALAKLRTKLSKL